MATKEAKKVAESPKKKKVTNYRIVEARKLEDAKADGYKKVTEEKEIDSVLKGSFKRIKSDKADTVLMKKEV